MSNRESQRDTAHLGAVTPAPVVVVIARSRPSTHALISAIEQRDLACELIDDARAASVRLARGDALAVVLDLDDVELGVVDLMRARGVQASVIALAGEGNVTTCVHALDRGVDDYVRTPCDGDELVARLRAAMRRSAAPRWAPLTCNGVTMLPDQQLEVGTARMSLSRTEAALLELLLRAQGEPVLRSTLLAKVSSPTNEHSKVLNVHIANLRGKLGGELVEIECVRSIGYRLRASGARAHAA